MTWLIGIILPYAAFAVFLAGVAWRVLRWSTVPVPFRIPAVCGQQKSLPWIRHSRLESPFTTLGVVGRMALEILLFRSLYRNTKSELRPGPKLTYGEQKWLWLGAICFHWSFLTIFLRHMRWFFDPVPACALWLDRIDSFFQVGAPFLYASDVLVLAALTYLLLRRILNPQVRYISLASDYFALALLLGVAVTGVTMRYFAKVDLFEVKRLAMGLAAFSPVVPPGIGWLFFLHLALVCVLAAYFPFSKLMHMAGIWLSPTRNLANNNRAKRHVNPWNYPVKVHTYEEWENEFREKMVAAGLPTEK
jgi:nitrate reductase gamma subunit